jgi:hypothetical protein
MLPSLRECDSKVKTLSQDVDFGTHADDYRRRSRRPEDEGGGPGLESIQHQICNYL